MIISASRRTDIPVFYSDWFFNRLRKGYVEVRILRIDDKLKAIVAEAPFDRLDVGADD